MQILVATMQRNGIDNQETMGIVLTEEPCQDKVNQRFRSYCFKNTVAGSRLQIQSGLHSCFLVTMWHKGTFS